MSEFYGQIKGKAQGLATREGSKSSGLRVSCQSYNGSVIVATQKSGVFSIEVSDESSFYGTTIWTGTVDELKRSLKKED